MWQENISKYIDGVEKYNKVDIRNNLVIQLNINRLVFFGHKCSNLYLTIANLQYIWYYILIRKGDWLWKRKLLYIH